MSKEGHIIEHTWATEPLFRRNGKPYLYLLKEFEYSVLNKTGFYFITISGNPMGAPWEDFTWITPNYSSKMIDLSDCHLCAFTDSHASVLYTRKICVCLYVFHDLVQELVNAIFKAII